jgi:ABC-type transport system involved in multi-copper enzyme maturation permease subunit
MKALAFKELREVAGIALIALVCYGALASNLMGAKVFDWLTGMPQGTNGVPFVSGGFGELYTLVTVVFAAALGFRQSAVESARGTFLFLLHRPVSRDAIFRTKLVVGVVVLLACGSVPILLYGTWASLPGTHPSPFEWSMTAPHWQFLLLTPLVYLGAFLSGLRPGWWLGTRLLPLIAALASLVTLYATEWSAFAVAATVGLLLLALGVGIGFVARERDYA